MSASPMVSVIMPTYNHADFLKDAMESVLSQTFKNFELIVVDNFSTDSTKDIVHSFGDDRVIYKKFANEGIIAASRNHGIHSARGKYVAFIDSDDLWSPDKLSKQVKLLFETHSELGLVCGYFRLLSSEESDQGHLRGPKNSNLNGFYYKELFRFNFIVSSSAMVSREALDQVGVFDESEALRCAEDFDLWLRVARKFPIACASGESGIYRIHASNESAGESRLQKAFTVIDKHCSKGWISKSEASRSRANFCFQVGWTLIDSNSSEARQHFTQALKTNPFNFKLWCVCTVGFMFSFCPGFFQTIRSRRIDRKLARKVMNPQNI